MNHAVVGWALGEGIYFTRSRPYRKNDQAAIESKNGHHVRKYAFYHRYDTPAELRLLNRLWKLVNDRFNYLAPTTKPIGWSTDATGRRKRIYDAPRTPLARLIDCGVLSPEQEKELLAYRDSLNPISIAREIALIQSELTRLASNKSEQLHLVTPAKALTPIEVGVRAARPKAA